MRLLPLLLALLLCSTVARAQGAANDPALRAAATAPPAPRPPRSRAARIVVSSLADTVAIAGPAAGCVASSIAHSSIGAALCLAAPALVPVGVAFTTFGLGAAMDGDAPAWAPLSGAAIGLVPPLVLAAVAFALPEGSGTAADGVLISAIVAAPLTVTAGAVIGYELTSHTSRREFRQRARPAGPRARVLPTFSPAEFGRGGIVGFAASL